MEEKKLEFMSQLASRRKRKFAFEKQSLEREVTNNAISKSLFEIRLEVHTS